MGFSKAAAFILVLSLFASANAEIYFNQAVPPKVSEALATSNEILCTYLNVNCAPGESGFSTPPMAPSPPAVPGPAPSPKGLITPTLVGRKMKL